MSEKLIKRLEKSKERKLMNEKFSVILEKESLAFEKKIKRVKECGNIVIYATNEEEEKFKLHGGIFCQDRLCPICSLRKANKLGYELLELITYIKQENKNYEFIFLTLTVPNVIAEELENKLKEMANAYKKLIRREDFKVIKGFFRKLEITYNKKTKTYHPHYHCLLVVSKSYFQGKLYIKRDKWLELWKKVMNDFSISQVDVRKAKFDNSKDVLELAKYTTKMKDLLDNENEVFKNFYISLRGKRIINFGGILKYYRKLQEENNLILNEESKEKLKENIIEFDLLIRTKWNKNEKYEIEKIEYVEKFEDNYEKE